MQRCCAGVRPQPITRQPGPKAGMPSRPASGARSVTQARAQPAGVQGSSSRSMRRATSMRPPSDIGATSLAGRPRRPSAESKKPRRKRRLATWYWSPLVGERKKSSAKTT